MRDHPELDPHFVSTLNSILLRVSIIRSYQMSEKYDEPSNERPSKLGSKSGVCSLSVPVRRWSVLLATRVKNLSRRLGI